MMENLTLLLVIATFLLVFVTAAYAWSTYLAVDTMRAQIVASARPYVCLDFVPEGPCIEAVLRNTGSSAAHDVTVSLTPRVNIKLRGAPQGSSLMTQSVSLMPPRKEFREFLGNFAELEADNASLRWTGEVAYFDSSRHKFTETFTIDVRSRKDMAYIGRTTIEEELEKLNENISGFLQSLKK